MKREYKLKHIQDFIKEYYGYDWIDFKVIENKQERRPRMCDFKNSYFSAVVILFKDNKRCVRLLECSNVRFKIHGENNTFASERWQELLAYKANQEEIL